MIPRRTREQANEDTRRQDEYTAQTCTYCIHGDHELPIPKGETCTCPCHGLPQEVVVQ